MYLSDRDRERSLPAVRAQVMAGLRDSTRERVAEFERRVAALPFITDPLRRRGEQVELDMLGDQLRAEVEGVERRITAHNLEVERRSVEAAADGARAVAECRVTF